MIRVTGKGLLYSTLERNPGWGDQGRLCEGSAVRVESGKTERVKAEIMR